MLRQDKAQSTLEYAVIIVVVMAALFAIQFYMQRGVQGKLRESGDKIGEQYAAGKTLYKYTDKYTEQKTKEQVNTPALKDRGSKFEINKPATRTRSNAGTSDGPERTIGSLAKEKLFDQ